MHVNLLRPGLQATAFREAHDGRHELSARFNILPVVSPVASVESRIKDMERKRSKDEGHLFSQADAFSSLKHKDCPQHGSCRQFLKCVP